jgi:signal transduction histidine kinase
VLLVCVAFAAAVVAFGAAIFISQRAAQQIREYVADVTENANPSVMHLVRERDVLSQLHVDLLRYRDAVTHGATSALDVSGPLARADQEWQLYDATPLFPGEKELQDRVLPRVDHLEELVRKIAAASVSDRREALRLIDGEAPKAFRDASDGLMDLVVLNQQEGHAAALQVEALRRTSAQLAWGLGAFATLLVLVLAGLVVRSLQELGRLQTERARILEQRAVEHEIFAARVVHDIRAPLTVGQLWLERVRGQPSEKLLSEGLEKVSVSLRRASQLVEDLYAFARANIVDRGRRRTPLREAVKYAVDEATPRAEGAGIELHSEPVPEVTIAAAPGVVASVLSNLLSNAINYAGRGARVTVRAVVGDQVHVDVADTGVGIPPEVQSRIFEPYVRGEATAGVGGLGLGLATVKQLVERNGGACGVESREGAGTRFWFELPLLNSSQPAPA